jgi:hypothetical protein
MVTTRASPSNRVTVLRRVAVAGFTAAAVTAVPLPARAASTVCVEVVVDYGQLSGGRVAATCVVVAKDATGAQVLDARAKKLGVPKPRYRADGLLCAIDGVPEAPDCAEQTGDGGFKYWSYWHKQRDSAWTYAQSGPFDYTVTGDHPGEGWAWVEGKEKNSRPPAAVSYTRVCPLNTPTPKPSSGGNGNSSNGSSRFSSAPRQPAAATSTAGQSTVRPTTTATARPRATAGGTDVSATPTATPTEVALSDPPRQRDDSGTPLIGVLAGGVIIAGIGGAAIWRARRATPS